MAAALLARAGQSVTLLEGADFPRFQIGESLLPASNAVLREVGVWEKVEAAGFVRKAGAEFTYGDGSERVRIWFRDGLVPDCDYTYQVERQRFDVLLLEHAKSSGVTVRQPVRASRASWDGARWQVELAEGETLEADYLIDAGGRRRFLARQLGIERHGFDPPARVALYGHFRGVQRQPGEAAGNIIITRVPEGWFWSIPLDAERTSVGLVTQRKPSAGASALFAETVAASPFMRDWMAEAEPLGELRTADNFSFWNARFTAPNAFMVGDAAAFIDPVFSSGVALAMEGGRAAARAILQANGRPITARARRRYERDLWARLRTMLHLVRLFYTEAGFSLFSQPTHRLPLPPAVNPAAAAYPLPPAPSRWRYQVFKGCCAANRRFPLVPRIDLAP